MTAERPGAGLGLWVVALASLFALRLLMVATSADSLHVDEAQYWDWSRTLQWGYYSKPPAIAVLIAASDAVFGSAEIGVRALAMGCYPLTAVVLAALARDIVAGDEAGQARPDKGSGHAPAAAWWAAALFMASPIAGLLGMVATTDALLLLCWASALWALWQAVVRRRHRAWVGFAAACGVGLLDKYSMLALLPGAAVFVWRRGDRRAMAGLLASGAAALLLWSPNLWWNAQAGWPTLRHTADITLRQQDAGGAGAALASLAEFSLGQVLILAPLLLPWLAWCAGRGRRADAEWPGPALPRAAACLLFWTSLPMAAAGLLQAARSSAEVNWIAPVHLSVVLALAPWLARRGAARTRQAVRVLALQLVLVSALGCAPWLQRQFAPAHALPVWLDAWARMRGWSGAFAELAPALQTQQSTGAVRLIGASRGVMAHAAYHWRGRGLERAAWAPNTVAASHYELSCPWRVDMPGRWLVLSQGPPPGALAAALGGLELVASAKVDNGQAGTPPLQLWRPLPAGAPAPDAPARPDTDSAGLCR